MIIKSIFVWKNFNEILSPALEIYNECKNHSEFKNVTGQTDQPTNWNGKVKSRVRDKEMVYVLDIKIYKEFISQI